jgi:hypothetical protein
MGEARDASAAADTGWASAAGKALAKAATPEAYSQ